MDGCAIQNANLRYNNYFLNKYLSKMKKLFIISKPLTHHEERVDLELDLEKKIIILIISCKEAFFINKHTINRVKFIYLHKNQPFFCN